jgi:hypothetical protein
MIKRTNKKNSNRKTISEMIKRRRVFKEQEDIKEINTMDELIDFIDENYEMVGSVDDLRELDSWSVTLYNGSIDFMLDAHVDERDGQIYFGVAQLKDIISNPIYGWEDEAEHVIDKELDSNPTEYEIEEAAHDIIDSYLMDDDSYDPSYSFDGKLPMTENEVFSIISDGADSLERERDRMMDGLVSEIKHMLNKTESKKIRRTAAKTSPRKVLKEASVQSFTDWEYPVLKDVMSTFKDDIQWALSRSLYSMKSNLPRLESDNESEVLRALADILDKADDMNKVKKALKRTSLGQRMW